MKNIIKTIFLILIPLLLTASIILIFSDKNRYQNTKDILSKNLGAAISLPDKTSGRVLNIDGWHTQDDFAPKLPMISIPLNEPIIGNDSDKVLDFFNNSSCQDIIDTSVPGFPPAVGLDAAIFNEKMKKPDIDYKRFYNFTIGEERTIENSEKWLKELKNTIGATKSLVNKYFKETKEEIKEGNKSSVKIITPEVIKNMKEAKNQYKFLEDKLNNIKENNEELKAEIQIGYLDDVSLCQKIRKDLWEMLINITKTKDYIKTKIFPIAIKEREAKDKF